MAVLDSVLVQTPFGASAITVTDGAAASVTVIYEGAFSWEETGRTVTEALNRDRRGATPNIIETGDNTISITLDGLITSYLGDSNTHIYEALTFTGNASGWTSTSNGSADTYTLAYTSLEPNSGTTQTLTFPFCHTDSISTDPRGDDGKTSFSASITCYANRPTIT